MPDFALYNGISYTKSILSQITAPYYTNVEEVNTLVNYYNANPTMFTTSSSLQDIKNAMPSPYPETTTLENFLIALNAPTDFSSYPNKDNIASVKTRFYTTQNGVFSINTVNFNYFGLDNTKTLADAIAKLSEPLPMSTLYLGNKVKVGQNGKLDAGSTQIVNVAAPVNAQDAATMGYVNASVDVQKLRIDDIMSVTTITQSGAVFTGNLTGNVTGNASSATNATNVNSLNAIDNFNLPLIFSDSSNDGLGALKKSPTLVCNPSTGSISATSFLGNATNATNVNVTAAENNALYYPTFVSGSTSGNKALFIDSTANYDLNYNPGTSTLLARNISSYALTSLTSYDIRIATASTGNTILFNNQGSGGNICNMNTAGFNMADGKTISAASSAGAELAFNVPNSTGNLTFTGTNIQSATSGASSGQFLRIKLNGVFYKIKLENDS